MKQFLIKHKGNGSKRLTIAIILFIVLYYLFGNQASGQTIEGILRGKFETTTLTPDNSTASAESGSRKEQLVAEVTRFEVRNARISFSNSKNLDILLNNLILEYKAEIDLCDEGSIKMLDAYSRLKYNAFSFTIGQFRVPFSIDAHRNPYKQLFANRSFIAKYVGNIRDVGAQLSYEPSHKVFSLTAGLFNGSGLTNQKNFWTSSINYSSKLTLNFLPWAHLCLSAQKIKPQYVNMYLYDAGLTLNPKNFFFEIEYLYEHYQDNCFKAVNAFNIMTGYKVNLHNQIFKNFQPLLRYDYASDHWDGVFDTLVGYRSELSTQNSEIVSPKVQQCCRSRITIGTTFALNTKTEAFIRLNYEKYFYNKEARIKISENDKFVIEFVTKF
ncbi:MAG: porin [Bacteroidales bacterium]|nr:porin [Bacteroidales bacterium]